MSQPDPLSCARFPRTSKYHPDWIQAGASGGANVLWLTEWLTESLELRPGMRILDLGCGRAMSSIFLAREFGVHVWAADLWFCPSENAQRIRDAGLADRVYPLRAEARSLPFAPDFFDAIVSLDSFLYYGTDEFYLNNLARFVKPKGMIGIAQVGLSREYPDELPEHLRNWFEQDHPWGFHTKDWWASHWRKSGILEIQNAELLTEGWRYWKDWLTLISPENKLEIETLEADAGQYLGYVKVIGRRRPEVTLHDLNNVSIPPHYEPKTFLRGN